jgi:hypothetical protein
VVFNKCVYFSQADDESTDITSTTQMSISAGGVTFDFEVFEELVDLHSMQGQTKKLDFIQSLLCSRQKHEFELFEPVGSVTDATPSMTMVWCLLRKHMQNNRRNRVSLNYPSTKPNC